MASKIVRLHLPPKLLAQIKSLEIHRHLQSALFKLPKLLPANEEVKLLNRLTSLLNNPLFLHAIAPRLRLANPHSIDSPATADASLITTDHLGISTTFSKNSWTTQLHYGTSVLIEAGDLNVQREQGCERSVRWFCEEVEFLCCEFGARVSTVREGLGGKVGERGMSKVVRLKLKTKMKMGKGRGVGGVQKRGW
ncbi:hypothetical protein EKO04_001981 [Ascochyta lentis]|uniref:Uncharacterized protein n=1 Tax=Ascochyta lentis TaxID=205686 RepID=A0A8H7JCQ8_9PLEO|nr:hypothetical protein EKO04_001981 [Ascochyta lentis]